MTRCPEGLALVCAVVVTLHSGCTNAPLLANAPREVEGEPLTPYAMHEVCAELETGDRLEYSFQALAPLHFNIQYREGNAVLVPLSRDGVDADSGVFKPLFTSTYCLQWEAGPQGTLLDYRVRIVRGRRT